MEEKRDMKVTSVEVKAVQGLMSPWLFCVIRTDDGITGYSEFGDGRLAKGMAGLVEDLSDVVIGKDARAVEQLYTAMVRAARMAYGGATWMAIAGIELALWDVKAKALGIPVYELFGGPTRTHQKVYWSHLLSYQASHPDRLGVKAPRSYEDVKALVRAAMDAGYDTFKTNILIPQGAGQPFKAISQGRRGPLYDQNLTPELLNAAVAQIAAIREEAGPDAGICLDVNENFKAEGQIRLGQALEPYNMYWLEIDNLDAESLRMVKDATRTPVITGEQKLGPTEYLPFFEKRAMNAVKVDVQWQGFIPARQTANMAAAYDMNIAPHNFNGHLSTYQSMALCASVANVRISESDPAQVPWRDEIVTHPPEIKDGLVTITERPGWGTDLDEKALEKYRT